MIWTRTGGPDDGPLLVMLHGLGATGEVYAGLERLLPERWPGGWLVADLPGHGRSSATGSYGFAAQARALAEALADVAATGRETVLLGHSMGGLVALALAPLRPDVRAVVGFSTKTWWPAHHVEQARAQALRPVRHFATREEAVLLHRRVAGLSDLVSEDDPSLDAGVVHGDAGWRLAQDPATNDFGTPDVAALLADVRCPVTLARGSADPFVRAENLSALVPDPVTLEGLGHHPHVEAPDVLLRVVVERGLSPSRGA